MRQTRTSTFHVQQEDEEEEDDFPVHPDFAHQAGEDEQRVDYLRSLFVLESLTLCLQHCVLQEFVVSSANS